MSMEAVSSRGMAGSDFDNSATRKCFSPYFQAKLKRQFWKARESLVPRLDSGSWKGFHDNSCRVWPSQNAGYLLKSKAGRPKATSFQGQLSHKNKEAGILLLGY